VENPSEVSRSAELVTESNNPEFYVQQKASLQITWSGERRVGGDNGVLVHLQKTPWKDLLANVQ
jgi:hypothetical protein